MTMHLPHLQSTIELAWDGRASLGPTSTAPEIREAVAQVIADLNAGRIRVAERQGVGQWTVNQWIKKAVLLSFRLNDNQVMHAGELTFFDKVTPSLRISTRPPSALPGCAWCRRPWPGAAATSPKAWC